MIVEHSCRSDGIGRRSGLKKMCIRDRFKEVAQRDFKRVVISGSGSSFHAGTGAKLYMQKTMGIPVDVIYPFQAEDYLFTQPSETLFIGISQSGTSLSAFRAMEHAKAQGCVLASMAGRRDEGVILDTVADYTLTVPCGEEGDLQPKTKGFLCTIVNLQPVSYTHLDVYKRQPMGLPSPLLSA